MAEPERTNDELEGQGRESFPASAPEQKPSNYDEQVHPPQRASSDDAASGEDERPDADAIEPGVPPAFDPATR